MNGSQTGIEPHERVWSWLRWAARMARWSVLAAIGFTLMMWAMIR